MLGQEKTRELLEQELERLRNENHRLKEELTSLKEKETNQSFKEKYAVRILESLPDMLTVFNHEGTGIGVVSSEETNHVGVPNSAFAGMHMRDMIPEEAYHNVYNNLQKVASSSMKQSNDRCTKSRKIWSLMKRPGIWKKISAVTRPTITYTRTNRAVLAVESSLRKNTRCSSLMPMEL